MIFEVKAYNVYLTNNFAEACVVVLIELCDINITTRFTRKTEYESLPKITNNLLLSIFVNTPVNCNQYNYGHGTSIKH